GLAVVGEAARGVAVRPAAGVLERLGQVPVIESRERPDPGREQRIDEAAVVVEAALVGLAAPDRLDARPGDREPVAPETEVAKDRAVLVVAVVGVTGEVTGVAVPDPPRRVREAIPDALALAVLVPGALDLVGRSGGAPLEPLGKDEPPAELRHCFVPREWAPRLAAPAQVPRRGAVYPGSAVRSKRTGRRRAGRVQESTARIEPPAPREWALLALLALAFAPALLSLAEVWRAVEYQSHGFLVPVVSLWVALRERYAWRRLAVQRDARGGLLLAAALGAYAIGVGIGSAPLQGVALVGAVAGAVLLLRGAAWLRQLAFPISFLLFMVPVPPAWIAPLIVRLQLFVTDASVAVLDRVGIAVAREGNVIQLPTGDSLFVAEAGSGVPSVITLAPLGVLLAYLTLRGTAARALLVAAVVPLAMLGNLARVL